MNKYVKARADNLAKKEAKETLELKKYMDKYVRNNVKRLVYAYTHGDPSQILRAKYHEFNSPAVRVAVVTRVLDELYHKGLKFTVVSLSDDYKDFDVIRQVFFYDGPGMPKHQYKPEEE